MILVTGANGFIGSALVWALNQKQIKDIICVDSVSLEERPLPLKNLKFSKFLLKKDLESFLLSSPSLDWILHMGACSSTTEKNREFLLENNTLYTEKIFQWATKHLVPVIHASSAATYGAGELGFDDEISPEKLKPLNLYGESKVLTDRWLLNQKELPPHWYALRFFNVYGPQEYHKGEMASVVYKACLQIHKTRKLKLFRSHLPDYKDGEQLRDFIYVKDIVRWILELMEKKPTSGIYNMGCGQARTWLDLAKATFAAMGYNMEIEWMDIPDSLQSQYQYFTEAQMQKWQKAGLSSPQWTLESGIQDYISKYLYKNQEPHCFYLSPHE